MWENWSFPSAINILGRISDLLGRKNGDLYVDAEICHMDAPRILRCEWGLSTAAGSKRKLSSRQILSKRRRVLHKLPCWSWKFHLVFDVSPRMLIRSGTHIRSHCVNCVWYLYNHTESHEEGITWGISNTDFQNDFRFENLSPLAGNQLEICELQLSARLLNSD